jgi:hypothetical protein
MSLEEISALPNYDIAADDCVLYFVGNSTEAGWPVDDLWGSLVR